MRDPLAGKDWVNAQVFGQLRPLDEPSKCLGVVKDPFSDPWLRRNPLKVLDCSGVEPRQTSWFVTKNVQTVRVALLRFGHSPDHLPLPKRGDDELKATFQLEMERLSAQYRRLGVRFVFDPDHDFLHIEDKVADDPKNGKAIAAAIAKIAADQFYGKITVALSERGTPGGTSAWNVEYDPDRSVDPVSGGKFDYVRWKQDSDSFFDKSGLPAVSNFIDVGAVEVRLDSLSTLRQAQEFGRYFSLNPLHINPAPADAPEDNGNWRAWIDAGAPPCGNLARLSLNGKTFQPDRTNAEGPWGCAIGRSLSALTPMQLARADWTLRYQLDRIPLTACGPAGSYNGDVVRCDGEEALALCQETSAYLKKISSGAETLACVRGGIIQDAIRKATQWPGLQFIFKSTPEGQALISALAGKGRSSGPVADKTYDDVMAALAAGKNAPAARALLNRVDELRQVATRENFGLAEAGFTGSKKQRPLKPAELDALKKYAGHFFEPGFIANVPAILK